MKQVPSHFGKYTGDLQIPAKEPAVHGDLMAACQKKKKKAVWPPCGLLGVSPGSAGYSWSSDLCCWTPRAPSGRRTPPGRKKYHEGGKERKTKKMSSFFQLVVKIQYCIFFLPFKKKSLYLIQSSDLILRINFFIKGNKKWAGATFAPLIFFFHWSIS